MTDADIFKSYHKSSITTDEMKNYYSTINTDEKNKYKNNFINGLINSKMPKTIHQWTDENKNALNIFHQ